MSTAAPETATWSPLTDHSVPPSISSRPVYHPLVPDPTAMRHLLVVETAALKPGQMAHLASSFDPVCERLQVLATGSGLSMPGARDYPSLASTLLAIEQALEQATMGHRVYALGSEPYLWSVYNAVLKCGLDRLQIHLCHSGSMKRRVWCTHCHSQTENVTTSIATCAGCGRHLLVRDHFSRRLGAFMGVQIDAEVPGQIPASEEVFR